MVFYRFATSQRRSKKTRLRRREKPNRAYK
jgi:hypothetical protein